MTNPSSSPSPTAPEPASPALSYTAVLHLLWVFVATFLMAAHFLRFMVLPLALFTLLLPLLLFARRTWAVRVEQVWLALGTLMWLGTTRRLVLERQLHGEPYLRLALILVVVTLFSAGAVIVLGRRPLRRLLGR